MMKIYIFLGVLGVLGTALGASYLKGRSDGRTVEALRQSVIVKELNETIRQADLIAQRREQERLQEVAALEASIEDLRRQADEDPDADRPAIGTNSVRRINSVN